MDKRAQLTIFIIIALLIVIIGLFSYFIIFRNTIQKEKASIKIKEYPKEYIESCLRENLIDALFFVSLQGGYYTTRKPFLLINNVAVPFYYYNKEKTVPNLDVVKLEIQKYLNNYYQCNLSNLTDIKDKYNINFGPKTFYININNNSISSTLKQRIIFERKGSNSSFVLNSFSTTINFNFVKVYDITNDIIKKYEDTYPGLPVSFLENLSKQVSVQVIPIEEKVNLIILKFSNTLRHYPLQYAFLIGYDLEGVKKELSNQLIEPIPQFNITKNSLFKYKVKLTSPEDNVTFFDDTDLFEINKTTGIIQFNATKECNGYHKILIGVRKDGMVDVAIMTLNISIQD